MTKRRKFEVPAGAVYALLAATTLICITVLAVALGGGGEDNSIPPPTVPMSHLMIEDVYFMESEGEGDDMRITIYMTNDGTRDADNVKAHIWPVIEGKNVATDKEEITFGDIRINETMVGETYIALEEGTLHSVEILVFDSGKLVLKGEARISTDAEEGTQYENTEVRGTPTDSDYDGMSDAWEMHYGLDPNDPSDAYRDNDSDGISNLDEYRIDQAPAEEPGDVDDDSPIMGLMDAESDEGGAAAIGAGLFLVLIIGVIVALIAGAIMSHRKKEKESFFKDDTNGKKEIKMEIREGYHDEEIEGDIPMGRGIYE